MWTTLPALNESLETNVLKNCISQDEDGKEGEAYHFGEGEYAP